MFPQPLVTPQYGRASLADVLPSAAAQLGVPGYDNVLELPEGDRFVIMLVDGLGAELLDQHAALAPYLSGLRQRTITAGVPSTTVTSLTSLGTGRPPGSHGMMGFTFRVHRAVFSPLSWNQNVVAEELQPHATVFDHARNSGVATSSVSPALFEGSGLTKASLRGPKFVGVPDETDVDFRVQATVNAAVEGPKSLVYTYDRDLDHVGHGQGVNSQAWRDQLSACDAICAQLRASLPEDVRLIITGDHGMLDVPGRNFVVVEDEPELLAEVTLLAGEGRLRHLYTRNPDAVAARWEDRLGDHAWVRTREAAIAEGWFGAVELPVRDRIGDVLVAMRTDWAVMTRAMSREMELVGMHGSLTPVEMNVPLLID